ncbi:hypothetical protein PR202_gb07635 [Eleusine coracana subsp. coracana]|uniref:F-box domain-containing protein n=1 Tax=Eleusine coracana subsp. coracana TaxID=191504 RepID=A0AAV5EA74_ELECO|nr:hypothetical protein PR202_gb07635 [Eleusine coracana subsp. coracana]
MTQRYPPTSPASPAPPLEDENILAEILLRLPPHPTSLYRASRVCKRWRHLIRDPEFLRGLRAFHRTPPVLGFFHNSPCPPRFVCAEGSPGRILHAAAALRRDGEDGMWWFVECRHGRSLLRGRDWADLLVWDPMTAERRGISVPYRVRAATFDLNAAVLCPSTVRGDCHYSPFDVVVVCTRQARAFACVYSSATGSWCEVISTQMPSSRCELTEEPGALVEDALYWLLDEGSILEFQLGNQRLALVELPSETFSVYKRNIRVGRSEGGGLGLTAMKNFSMHLWAREVDHLGTEKWVLGREIDLYKLLALPLTQPRVGSIPVWISGLAEDGNAVFLRIMVGIFVVWPEIKKFKMLTNSVLIKTVDPYASFYVPEGNSLVVS